MELRTDNPQTIDLCLRPGPDAPRQARRALARLTEHLPLGLRWDTELLVSELVANSIRHGSLREQDHVRLQATVTQSGLRVEVTDPARPLERDVPLDLDPQTIANPRSGFWLLNRIALRWGIERDGAMRVWFETDLGGSNGNGGPAHADSAAEEFWESKD